MKYELPSVDTLIDLAKNKPEELERLRQEQIAKLIDSAPAHIQRRLRGLQFQIDSRRKMHESPMGACLMLSKMMMDSLSRLNSALHGSLLDQPITEHEKPAAIIPFPTAVNN